ncbi:periplasmic binding protein [Pyrolobus fumarii 1A]|uniref:Periplasmic binding protein n=1 Tax=Pyrolobus fumarii (strain DSM 11204 / 1A) TaxID=694429 RepID=G0EG45_PYRF1|nr:ABC transporter substrate-binding protein [Pyrolobus fumarii]AEM38293.1 periplasmic binding protein [Pyrolobus fumarii 1A]
MRVDKHLLFVVLAVAVGVALLAWIASVSSPQGTGVTTNTGAAATTGATSGIGGRTVTLTDLAGRRVTLRVPVERVVVIDGGHTGYIVAIDAVAGERGLRAIVGLDLSEWRRVRPQLYTLYVSTHPWLARVADVGASYKQLDIEEIIRLKPDAVLAHPTAFERLRESGGLARLEKAGIPVVVIDFHSEEWSKTKRSIEILGVLFGAEDRARELIEWYREHLRLVEERVGDLHKPPVYIEAGYRAWRTWGSGYMWGRLVEIAGGKNIAGGLFPRSGDVNPEFVAEAQPEVIIVTGGWWASGGPRLGPNVTREEALRSLAEWVNRTILSTTPALRHYRVCAVYHALARTVWDVVGLEYLAKAIHPAAMRDVNVTRDLEEFFERFLSIPFRGTWFVCLEPPRRQVTITDALGRRVTITAPAQRIAVMYGLEDLVAVGGEDALSRLVALNRFRYERWRPDWWYMWTSHFPWMKELPNTGQPGYGLNLESIIESKPDVLIVAAFMYKQLVESGAIEKLERAGIPVVVIDFVPKTTSLEEHLEAVRRSIYALGVITGYEDRAERLYKLYEEHVEHVIERVSGLEPTRVLVLATWSKWRAYGAGGMYQVWITLANGENIAADVVKGTSGDINPEHVIKRNPQVIIFTCNNNIVTAEGTKQIEVIGYTVNSTEPAKRVLRALIERPGWEKLEAVKSCRVYLIHHGLSHGHVFQYVALEYIAKWLHPEAFADLDPHKSLEEFFEEYMPFPLRGVWAVGLCGA